MTGSVRSPAAGRDADHAQLRAVRAVLRRRGDRLGAADLAYRVYLGAMLSLIIVAPLVRSAVLWIQSETLRVSESGAGGAAAGTGSLVSGPLGSFLEALEPLTTVKLLALMFTLCSALLVLAGTWVGPARASLPQLDLLFISPISRARLLRPTIWRWLGIGALCGLGVVAIANAAHALRAGAADDGSVEAAGFAGVAWGNAICGLLSGMSLGVFMAALPLLGQFGRRSRWITAALLIGFAMGAPAALNPWMNLAEMILGGPASPGAVVLTAVLAAGAIVAAPMLAARLDRERLRAAAFRLDAAQTLLLSGDPVAGLASLGSPVRWGRRLRLRPGRRLAGMIIMRDLLGIVRAPGRSLAAGFWVLVAGMLWATALGSASPGGVLPGLVSLGAVMLTAQLGALSAVLTYFSVSAWCRGLRAAAQSSGVSPVLPMSPGALIVRHALVPAALAMLTCAVGLCAAWLIGGGLPVNGEKPGGSAGIPIAVLSTCTTVVIVMAVCASTALKGPIPLRMLTPIQTPWGMRQASTLCCGCWTGPS